MKMRQILPQPLRIARQEIRNDLELPNIIMVA